MKSLLKYKVQVYIILFFLMAALPSQSYSQGKEANMWYFGAKAAVDFNTGSPPVALTNSQMSAYGSASIADSLGNLLFYTNGENVWNYNHSIMPNGYDIGHGSTQGALIIPMVNNNQLYWIFNVYWDVTDLEYKFIYSIVDMSLNSGYGDIVADKKKIHLFDNVSHQFSAVKHANGNDIWVVTHGNANNYYYAFKVSNDSIYAPIISQAGAVIESSGYMKISPNGKKIAIAVTSGSNSNFELLDFNNETGVVSDSNLVHRDGDFEGVEFSPDNTKLYANGANMLNQYDLEAGTPQQILASEVNIASSGDGALQLGPDGKIYCVVTANNHEDYLAVIHFPNIKAPFCIFEYDYVDLEGRFSTHGLPSFIQSYLNDPVFHWQHTCLGDSTTFTIEDINGVDSVYWDFNDILTYPNNTSALFEPAHLFSSADTFDVSLTVYSGLIEKTVNQQVVIYPTPQPTIGNDTLMCDTLFSLDLDATCNATTYFWNTFESTPQITVQDTGIYFVRATNDAGCSGIDSIYIGLSQQPVIDTTNLVITNAGCGLADGSITGIQVTGMAPLQFFWINQNGDTIGNTLDISGLEADIYSLLLLDGNGCNHNIGDFIVEDNGTIEIDSVTFSNDHCNSSIGEITIFESNTGDIWYSIYGDSAWVQNNGVFTNIGAGEYTVIIIDSATACKGIYNNNPVIISNISGPQVSSVDITADINNLSTGSININASGIGDISYSIYNGSSPQINNGLFTNLSAGLYNCIVEDAFGCDTTFTAYVPQNSTDTLLAISGFGQSCEGEAVVIPINLVNFNDVYSFDVNLNYDVDIVMCDGYQNLNPILEDGFSALVSTNTGEVQLQWQGLSPVSLPDESTMCELIFRGLGEGISPVNWESSPGQSSFYDINFDPISASYFKGEVEVFSSPKIASAAQTQLCSGDSLIITPEITGGNGSLLFSWIGPEGFSSDNEELIIPFVQEDESGTYTIAVEDSMKCSNSQSYEVTVFASPQIAFSEYDTLWMEPGDILEAGTNYAYYYTWNTGATTPEINVDTCGLYSVEVVSTENCKTEKSVTVLWDGIPFYIPNAFTPNSDGLNDEFNVIPKYDYVKDFRLLIFNRWGQQIFTTNSYTTGWDGTFNGSACMPGAYIYKILYSEFSYPGARSVEGSVMLVR